MPRVPKGKNGLSAGERVRLYEQEQAEKKKRLSSLDAAIQSENEADKTEGSPYVAEIAPDIRQMAKEKTQVKEKKTLPKPESATVSVDLSVKIGKIGRMHGFCNGPVSYGSDITELFREIGVPTIRFDSTDGASSAYAVDISRIFKDKSADPNDPRSYDFSVTDKYVTAAYKSGARIIYRLGESRDKLESEKSVLLPENVELWISVAANVIRRYNDYFAGGYALGIEYFELWSHDYSLDREGMAAEFDFYRRVASTLKMLDTSLKVGGMMFRGCDDAAKEFIRYCRKNNAPLDFITLSLWESDPKKMAAEVNKANEYIKNQGFASAEIIVGEWGYADADAIGKSGFFEAVASDRLDKSAIFNAQSSIKGASFAAAAMLELNCSGVVSDACLFDAQPMISPFTAICDRFGKPNKPFYTFKAYGELYRAGEGLLCQVRSADGYAHSGIYAAAASSRSGECYIMIASHGGCGTVDLRIDGIADGLYTADAYILDGVKNLELGDSVPLSGAKKRMIFSICEYGIILVKLY